MVPDYGSPARSSRLFSEGQHYVEYRAVDAAGKDSTCSFTVTVRGQFAHLHSLSRDCPLSLPVLLLRHISVWRYFKPPLQSGRFTRW